MDNEFIKRKKEYFKVGAYYKHYPYGRKVFLGSDEHIRSRCIAGHCNIDTGEEFPCRCEDLICDKDGVPIVMYLGTDEHVHGEAALQHLKFLSGDKTYYISVYEFEDNDELIELELEYD